MNPTRFLISTLFALSAFNIVAGTAETKQQLTNVATTMKQDVISVDTSSRALKGGEKKASKRSRARSPSRSHRGLSRHHDGRRHRGPSRHHGSRRHRGPSRHHGGRRHRGPSRHHGSRRHRGPSRHHGSRRHRDPSRNHGGRRHRGPSRHHGSRRHRGYDYDWYPSGDEEPTNGTPTYIPGDFTKRENGLILSTGLTATLIATTGRRVSYTGSSGGQSSIRFHDNPDAGAVFSVSSGPNAGG
jgi:hypothetical protein